MNETVTLDTPMQGVGLDPAPEEVEIKLAASPAMMERLRAHPALQGKGKSEDFHTTYFDTADGALAAGKASLRLRRRAKGCEQTLKIALGRKGQMQRSEWNQPVPLDAAVPDPAAFPPPAARALDQMCKGALLVPYAQLSVRRETRLVSRGKALIEAAFDTGEIRAGDKVPEPIGEVELELCQGRLADLLQVALELPLGPELGWSISTKAQRAQALARGREAQAVSAPPVALARGMSAARAFQTIGWNALTHAVGNLGLVIQRGDPAAIHQLRVAIRRMRAAIALFGRDLLAQDPQAVEFRKALRDVATVLAPARDLHVLARRIDPPLPMVLRAEAMATAQAREALARPEAQRLWLALALWLEDGAYLGTAAAGASLEPMAAAMIEHQRKAIRGMRKRLAEMPDAQLHELRKDVKKLRYSTGFFQPLAKGRDARHHQDALTIVQDALGRIQDASYAATAGISIARMLELPRDEAIALQVELDAALGQSASGRSHCIAQAKAGLEQEKLHAGWWKFL